MAWWITLLICISAGIFEFVISFFFNYKIFWITKSNFLLAGIYGASATFLYTIMSGFIVYLSAVDSNPILLIFSAILISVGNFFSTIAVEKWQKYTSNKKSKKIKTITIESNDELFIDNFEENIIFNNNYDVIDFENQIDFFALDKKDPEIYDIKKSNSDINFHNIIN